MRSEGKRTTPGVPGRPSGSAQILSIKGPSAPGGGAENGQLTYQITSLVSESRHIYENDEIGLGYLAACDLGRAPLAAAARLPVIDPGTEMHADEASAPRVANMLLFVREVNASACVADPESGRERWIDTYRMIAVYPSTVDRSLVLGKAESRDLVVWRSVTYPSYRQVAEIGDEDEREAIIKDLRTRYGCTHAWDPSLPVDEAFFAMSESELSTVPEDAFLIEEDEVLSEGGRLVYAKTQLSLTDEGRALRRMVLGSTTLDNWVPDGFEVKVSGQSGSRKVWIHMVVEATAPDGKRTAVQAYTTMAHVRDF